MTVQLIVVCDVCAEDIRFIECPTGGWWAHCVHPADDHDASTTVVVEEEMDANGLWSIARGGE